MSAPLPLHIRSLPLRPLVTTRAHEVFEIRGANEAIAAATGWQPEIPLEKTLRETLAGWRRRAVRVDADAGAGRIRSDPRQTFPLRGAAAAHRALESRGTTGATVLLP